MKNIILFLSILVTENLYASGVGGGGVSGMIDAQKIIKVYQGANLISRNELGVDHLFTLDLQNKTVIFDVGREVLDESAVMTFDEVAKYALPNLKNLRSLDEMSDENSDNEELNP